MNGQSSIDAESSVINLVTAASFFVSNHRNRLFKLLDKRIQVDCD